jgi:Astacin (Peptidase family M12A)
VAKSLSSAKSSFTICLFAFVSVLLLGCAEKTYNSSPVLTITDENGVNKVVHGKIIDGKFMYQGDMILANDVSFASGARKFRRWENGTIPYIIEPNHPARQMILNAIEKLNANTSLWFKPTHDISINHVYISNVNECSAEVGEPISGDSTGVYVNQRCGEVGIMHELLHVAGLNHEQQREDRDTYVEIFWNNIKPEKHADFEMASSWWNKDVGPYNFASIMHYSCDDSGIDGQLTIVPRPAFKQAGIGQRVGLSIGDVNAVASMYDHIISSSRGKPVFAPQPLPTLTRASYSPACAGSPPPPPPTPAQCKLLNNQLRMLRRLRDEAEDVNERKARAADVSAKTTQIKQRGCAVEPGVDNDI